MAIVYRRTPLSDTQNFRDLGGYATIDGKVTRWNVFFRSACPDSLNGADAKLLQKLGVTAVIDLRGGGNVDEVQKGYSDIEGLKIYNLPLGGGIPPKRVADCPYSYLEIAESPYMAKVFKVLANNDGAVLFHCFAGKDRTGVVAALLLMLANAFDQDIIADYCQSYAYFLERIREDFARSDAERDVFIPHPEHIQGFMRVFREKYGDVKSFLLSRGVAESKITRILDKFVQKL